MTLASEHALRNFLEDPVIDWSTWKDLTGVAAMEDSFETSLEGHRPLYCVYEIDGYEGSSKVYTENNGRLMFNESWHCSCYGLEGMWRPEEYIPDQLRRLMESTLEYTLKPTEEFAQYVYDIYDQNGIRKGKSIE